MWLQWTNSNSPSIALAAQLRISGTFALLFDIMTTRRVIMSGEPHKVATELYR